MQGTTYKPSSSTMSLMTNADSFDRRPSSTLQTPHFLAKSAKADRIRTKLYEICANLRLAVINIKILILSQRLIADNYSISKILMKDTQNVYTHPTAINSFKVMFTKKMWSCNEAAQPRIEHRDSISYFFTPFTFPSLPCNPARMHCFKQEHN